MERTGFVALDEGGLKWSARPPLALHFDFEAGSCLSASTSLQCHGSSVGGGVCAPDWRNGHGSASASLEPLACTYYKSADLSVDLLVS